MDFSLTTEQEALVRTVGEIAHRHPDRAALWRALGRSGLVGLTWGEAAGGDGATAVELVLVAEALGRAGVVPPLAETVLAAGLLERSEDPLARETLAAMAAGECLVVPAIEEPSVVWSTARTGVLAVGHGGGWLLYGAKAPVRFGAEADRVVTVARDETGRLRLFVLVAPTAGDGLVLDGAPAWPVQLPVGVGTALDAAADLARIVVLGHQLGLMSSALDETVRYLGVREQYGAPLRSFQALAHRTADMFVLTETVRSTVYYSAMAVAADPGCSTVVARARVVADAAARQVAQDAVQLHGGIGLTAEHAIGGYLSEILRLSASFGGVRGSRQLLGRLVADSPTVDVLR